MMQKQHYFKTVFVVLFSLSLCMSAFAGSGAFEKKFNALVKQHIPNSAIGLIIQDPKTGKVVFEKNAEENFCPASNTKLFTASAALKFFGPNFQYQTSLHADLNKTQKGSLHDHIYLVFRGDPSLTVEDLDDLFKHLREKGVKEINGNVVVDDRAFEEPFYAPGWTLDSLAWYYSAPITAIILNENKVRYKLDKANELNEIIHVAQADETLPTFPLKAHVAAVTTEESEKSCQFDVSVKNNEILMGGCWPIEKTPTTIELAIDDPRALAKAQILKSLKEYEINLTGDIIFAPAARQIPVVSVKRSPPLKDLLFEVLAESNNIYAESLTKALGIAYLGRGTFQAGIIGMQEVLKRDSHLEFSQAKFSDGSGQSRYNLVSPYLIAQLLQHMYHDPDFGVFYDALSKAGESGTLAERLKGKEVNGSLIGKTGTITGVSALSGYFKGKDGKEYLFSMLINQSTKNSYAIRAFEDKLCQMMMDESWGKS
ncbi:MAG: D-alanyl-D-alanine carboxypeptidase/D-alanyl-D-alanine-endopeptidase [Candidatus Berkiellales bacterium]